MAGNNMRQFVESSTAAGFRLGGAVTLVLLSIVSRGVAAGLEPEQLYEATLPSVMTLEVEAKNGTKFVGTAFLAVETGIAVTAWHLVQDARLVTGRFSDSTECEVLGVVDRDEFKDTALLKVAPVQRPLLRLRTAAPLVGSRAYAVGAPKGYEFSISDGLVSQWQMVDGFVQCQVSCPISPGNSGGPILDRNGEVLAVVTWSKKDAQNLNFATPAGCLAELNPSLSVVPWGSLNKSRLSKRKNNTATEDRDTLLKGARDGGYRELREYLQNSSGKSLKILVVEANKERTFSFVVPKDSLK